MQCVKTIISAAILFGLIYFTAGAMEETLSNILANNYPYDHPLETDVQLAKLLLSQRLCHQKRNSELINSLLGLPKNMNNAGK